MTLVKVEIYKLYSFHFCLFSLPQILQFKSTNRIPWHSYSVGVQPIREYVVFKDYDHRIDQLATKFRYEFQIKTCDSLRVVCILPHVTHHINYIWSCPIEYSLHSFCTKVPRSRRETTCQPNSGTHSISLPS